MHISSTRHLCRMCCNRRMILRATNPEASWDIHSVWFASLLGKSLSPPWPWAGTVPCMALASRCLATPDWRIRRHLSESIKLM